MKIERVCINASGLSLGINGCVNQVEGKEISLKNDLNMTNGKRPKMPSKYWKWYRNILYPSIEPEMSLSSIYWA